MLKSSGRCCFWVSRRSTGALVHKRVGQMGSFYRCFGDGGEKRVSCVYWHAPHYYSGWRYSSRSMYFSSKDTSKDIACTTAMIPPSSQTGSGNTAVLECDVGHARLMYIGKACAVLGLFGVDSDLSSSRVVIPHQCCLPLTYPPRPAPPRGTHILCRPPNGKSTPGGAHN